MKPHWRTGVVLESLVLAGLIGTQFVAGAVGKDLPSAPSRPRVPQSGHTSPAALTGQLLVKYKDSVTACVHCLLKLKRPFHSATLDHSDSLDRLHAKYQVTAARPLFRTEVEEERLRGKALQVPLLKLQQHQQQQLDAVKATFPDRARRAPPGAVVPDLSQVYLVDLPEETDLEQAVWEFGQDPHVEYAQPNYLMEAAWLPNDPYYSSSGSWGQPATRGDADDLWALQKINAEAAWDLSQGQGVVVAVIDTGLDYTHPDLAANVWTNPGELPGNGLDDEGNGRVDDTRGYDFTTCASLIGSSCMTPKAQDNDPQDGHGHGTHVAGTIAAVGNNGLGIIGVAPQAKVLAVKALNDQGQAKSSDLAQALQYAATMGADVLNNSWACTFQCPSNPVVEEAVRLAAGLGATLVFAAGNSSNDVTLYSPQNMTNPKPLVVSATTHDDLPTSFTNTGWLVDLAAPGGGVQVAPPDIEPQRNILSLKAAGCNPTAANSLCPSSLLVGTNYLRQAGTSMAAPFVAGAAALVLKSRPTFGHEDIRQVLRASTTDVHSAGIDGETGTGRLNASQALAISVVPQVKIAFPAFGKTFSQDEGPVAITGTAAGSGFAHYTLSYGAGLFPTTWTAISGPVTASVTNGILGSWPIGSLANGTYTLKLAVTTTEGFQFQDRVPVEVIQDPWLRQLTSDAANQASPAIDGDRIIWIDYGTGDLVLYDLSVDAPRRLMTEPSYKVSPHLSGDLLVWQDFPNYTDFDVYFYDLTTNTTPEIASLPPPGLVPGPVGDPITAPSSTNQERPAISGNLIVWQDDRNWFWPWNYDLYLCTYDPLTGTCPETQLTTDSHNQLSPAISGNRIVWIDDRHLLSATPADLYLCTYNPTTGECPEQPIRVDPAYQDSPAIDGDRIVWADDRNGNWDIYLYDLSTDTERQLTTDPADQYSPAISGNRIVWEDWRNSNADIYLYDLSTNTERAITTHPGEQADPAISEHRIVWRDGRNGNDDIYLYEIPVPPTLNPIGNQTVLAGQLLSFSLSASDPNGEAIALSVSGLPGGASVAMLLDQPGLINEQFSWTPTCNRVGTYSITFTATDPGGLSDSETITITVGKVDSDGDGFSDCIETAIGTDPNKACPATPTANDEALDAWPLDFNDDRVCDISDVALVAGSFGQAVPPGPQRRDLNADGVIDISDVAKVAGAFGQSCP